MKVAIALIAVVLIVAVISLFFMTRGPDVSQFEHLKEPKISQINDQKMIVVEAKGDPNVVGKKAFELLFKTYFKIKGVSKGPGQPAPHARWPRTLDTTKSGWVGLYALPVPGDTAELPEYEPEPGLNVSLEVWKYGDVAEILHIGPYDKEEATVKRLVDFIKKQGYEIISDHEEEYIKGPGMFGMGNPDKYLTIIRYRVREADAP